MILSLTLELSSRYPSCIYLSHLIPQLDIGIGPKLLTDQFEWPLFSAQISPEEFAKILCSDLGIAGEFIPLIAHSIREQVCMARLNHEDATGAPEFLKVPVRPEGVEDDWEPEFRELTEEELERIAKEKERSSRRLRRSQKFNPITTTRGSSMTSLTAQNPNRQLLQQSLAARSAFKFSNPQAAFQAGQGSRVTHKNYQPTPEEINMFRLYNPSFNPALAMQNQQGGYQDHPQGVARKQSVPKIDTELVSKQIELMRNGSVSPVRSPTKSVISADGEHAPPRVHRGFGASATVFNATGHIEVGGMSTLFSRRLMCVEFRKNWRCSWCLLSGKFTPTLRKGPLGTKTLCNACGIWYALDHCS